MWFIDIFPLTGVLSVRKADESLSEKEITDQLLQACQTLPLWVQTKSDICPTQKELDCAVDKTRIPILLCLTEEHAIGLAGWLQSKFPSMPMPWSQHEAEKFLLALECVRKAYSQK